MKPFTDLSGRRIPAHGAASNGDALPRLLAVAPVRVFPPRDAVEFLYGAWQAMGPGTSKLFNPNSTTLLSDLRVPVNYQGHIDYIICECADVTPGSFPNNIFLGITFNAGNNPLNNQPYQLFPLFSSGSVASVAFSQQFDINIDVPPGTFIEMFAVNGDAVVHHIDAYLHGWMWPLSEKD